MSKTLVCIQATRSLILLLTVSFIALSALQILQVVLIPWPGYPVLVTVLLDLVLLIGVAASLAQHLKALIVFGWLVALTFLLIFFGNTVSTHYQSDLLGMFYLLLICILAFTDAVCIIKYRMPSEEAHHPFIKCSQQQLFEHADSLPLPPPPNLVPPPLPLPLPHHSQHNISAHSQQQHHHHHYHHHQPQQHPQHQKATFHPQQQHVPAPESTVMLGSPSSPLPPPPPLNSHYASKNDPQFHAV